MQRARVWLNQHPSAVAPVLVLFLALGLGLVVWESGILRPPLPTPPNLPGQGGGGPGGGGPGGGFAAMLRQHPQAFALGRFVRTLDEVDQAGEHPLTKPQAAAVLQVIRPLQKPTNLEEGAAKRALAQLQALLTPEQRRAVEAAQANGPGGPGSGTPGAGVPGGPPGPGSGAAGAGGPPPGPAANAPGAGAGNTPPQPFNPLSLQAPAGNERAARRAERNKAFTTRLEQRAAGS
jgi:hypothetical protein